MPLDLNCDLGESFGPYTFGQDEALLNYVTSANLACGFHAGDPMVMSQTVALAAHAGVAVGAHPGYPDLQGFGRRAWTLTPAEVESQTLYQIGALAAFTRAAHIPLIHVKPHGALYNQAGRDPALAAAIARAVCSFDKDLILVGLAGSALVAAGRAVGLRVAQEGFADRGYAANGALLPRHLPGAVLTDPVAAAAQAVQLAQHGVSINGQPCPVDTLCVHGDNPQAAAIAQAVRVALQSQGFVLQSLCMA